MANDTISRSWFCVLNNPRDHGYTGSPQEICEKLRDEWISIHADGSGAWAYCITQGLSTLCRLGRAVGISCILSTQRGSADLISGQIRNNALKIVGQCDENLSLLTIGTADAATELSHPGQFMDENKNVFQGFYADYTALLKKHEHDGRVGAYGLKQ